MIDVGFFWKNRNDRQPDLAIKNGDLVMETQLDTAVYTSVFSEGYSPDAQNFKKGFWADLVDGGIFGSELWRFTRGKLDAELISNYNFAIKQSLNWLIEEGYAREVNVNSQIENAQLKSNVEILRPEGEPISLQMFWDQLTQRIRQPSAVIAGAPGDDVMQILSLSFEDDVLSLQEGAQEVLSLKK